MYQDRYPLTPGKEGERPGERADDRDALPPEADYTVPNTVAEGFKGGQIPPHERVRAYRVAGPEQKLSSTVLKRVIAGVTIVAAAAGITAGVLLSRGSGGEPTEPRQTPSTSAPPAPGEAPSANAELSPATHTFEIDGKTYKGIGELEQAFGIKVDETAEYPNGEQIVTEAVNRLNLWMNYATTNPSQKEAEAANGYVSHDSQYVGIAGLVQDVINPAMSQAFTTESNSEGATVDGFVNSINELHLQNTAYGYQTLKAHDAVQYESKFTITGPINVHGAVNEGISATVPIVWADNGDQNTMGRLRTESSGGWDGVTTPTMSQSNLLHISLEPVVGSNGEKYWKISSANLG